ncbi:MAG: hypothetical protein H6774_01955 [Pseudomonadales bacterium]|nr:hypothetical protein [Pseudomonadales bacterium]
MLLPTLIAQFGDGFQPAVDNSYTQNADTIEGATNNTALVLSNIIGILTILGGLFFVVYFIIGALNWTLAGNDSGKVGKAIDQMRNATIGLALLVASYAIIGVIGSILGFNIFNIADLIKGVAPVTN